MASTLFNVSFFSTFRFFLFLSLSLSRSVSKCEFKKRFVFAMWCVLLACYMRFCGKSSMVKA